MKLSSLYYSICDIPLEHNTPLLSVGVWSLLESLTSLAGRADNVSFDAFWSNQKLQQYGVGSGKRLKPINDAVKRISENGNAVKHHHTAANFNGEQLANDMDTLKELILKCIEEAASKKS